MEICRVTVLGQPITQGSMNGFPVGKRVVLVDVHKKQLDVWRPRIADAVRQALPDRWEPADGPVRIDAWYAVARPTSESRTRRTWPVRTKGTDIDKMERAVHDALSGVFYVDDNRVCEMHVIKDFPGERGCPPAPGVTLVLSLLDPPVMPTWATERMF